MPNLYTARQELCKKKCGGTRKGLAKSTIAKLKAISYVACSMQPTRAQNLDARNLCKKGWTTLYTYSTLALAQFCLNPLYNGILVIVTCNKYLKNSTVTTTRVHCTIKYIARYCC